MELSGELLFHIGTTLMVAGVTFGTIKATGKTTLENQRRMESKQNELADGQNHIANRVGEVKTVLVGLDGRNGLVSRVQTLEEGHGEIRQGIAEIKGAISAPAKRRRS